jgi:hypothetical protein
MRSYVLSFTFLSLAACTHQAPPAQVAAAPLPSMSVQRELERKVGYEGEPGTMAFEELSAGAEAQGSLLDERAQHTRLAADEIEQP